MIRALPTESQRRRKESALAFQQIFHDAEPLRVERFSANSFPRSTIPVSCVALIAFFAMEVGVNPRPVLSFVLLSRFVGSRPIALGMPPESSEGESEFRRRFGLRERLTKIVQGHVRYSVT